MEKNQFGKLGEALWIDIIDPVEADLEVLGREYGLDSAHLNDCLQPEHHPKYETSDKTEFLILRTFDPHCALNSDTTQELTRKIAIFRVPGVLITIHRTDLDILKKIRAKWADKNLIQESLNQILFDVFYNVLISFDPPIDKSLDQLEELERSIFHVEGAKPFELQEAYVVKRRAFIFRRLFRSTLDVLQKVQFGKSVKSTMIQNIKEELESSLFYTEAITESTTALLNLHISLTSQRTNEASQLTNEVVRVLTIFSVFLLPLNVVTGIYGMNFKHMPELEWYYGYPMALGLMAFVVIITFLWFRSHGYLRGGFRIDGFRRAEIQERLKK